MICTIYSRNKSVQFPQGLLPFESPWRLVTTESVKISNTTLFSPRSHPRFQQGQGSTKCTSYCNRSSLVRLIVLISSHQRKLSTSRCWDTGALKTAVRLKFHHMVKFQTGTCPIHVVIIPYSMIIIPFFIYCTLLVLGK